MTKTATNNPAKAQANIRCQTAYIAPLPRKLRAFYAKQTQSNPSKIPARRESNPNASLSRLE